MPIISHTGFIGNLVGFASSPPVYDAIALGLDNTGSQAKAADNTSRLADIVAGIVRAGWGMIIFPPGLYWLNSTFNLPEGVPFKVVGAGWKNTTLKLAASANVPVISHASFGTLTGGSTRGGVYRGTICDLSIDGNKANNSSGRGVALYGESYLLQNVIIQNAKNEGLYTEYGGTDTFADFDNDLESVFINLRTEFCGGSGWIMKGPHDAIVNMYVSVGNGAWGWDVQTPCHATSVNTYLDTSGGIWVHGSGQIVGQDIAATSATGYGMLIDTGTGDCSIASGQWACISGPSLKIKSPNHILHGTVANNTTGGAVVLDGGSANMDFTMFGNASTWFDVTNQNGGSIVHVQALDGSGTLFSGTPSGTWFVTGAKHYSQADASATMNVGGGITFGDATTMTTAATGGGTVDVTLTAFGTSPDAKGASLSGQAITLQPADSTHPGSLKAADWVTFNAKQAAGNYLTALTSDVTASGPGSAAATIAANAVTNAKAAQMATLTIKGNNTGGTANSLDLTVSQVQTMLGTSGTNTGDVTLAAFGSTPNANGLSLSGQVLNMQPANATNGGGLSTTAQVIAGAKTFTSGFTVNNSADAPMTITLQAGLTANQNNFMYWRDKDGAEIGHILAKGSNGSLSIANSTGTILLVNSDGSTSYGVASKYCTFVGPLAYPIFATAYGATITINASVAEVFKIIVTDGVGFTISSPVNITTGDFLWLEIINSSGGAMGTVTFGADYILLYPFIAPANGAVRLLCFFYNGTTLNQVAEPVPNPTSTTLGGVQSKAAVSNQFLTSISTSGVPASAQPAFTDISGTATAAQLPNPGASSLGGIRSYAAVSNQWINTISTSGIPASAQPAFTDISGTASAAQLPNPGASSLGGVQSKASAASNFLTQISTSGVVSAAQPAFTDISGTATAAQLPIADATHSGIIKSDNTLQQVGVALEANQFVPLPVTLTWGSSITIDMSTGGYFRLTATDTTTVPTFNAPTNPYGGDTLLLRVNNSSLGAMQTPIWNAAFHFISATAPTKPATGFSYWIQFKYNGAGVWHQMAPAAGPVAN